MVLFQCNELNSSVADDRINGLHYDLINLVKYASLQSFSSSFHSNKENN